jgi:hypothetical protein
MCRPRATRARVVGQMDEVYRVAMQGAAGVYTQAVGPKAGEGSADTT